MGEEHLRQIEHRGRPAAAFLSIVREPTALQLIEDIV